MDTISVLGANAPDCRLMFLARLRHAPFPYDGPCGDDGRPFFDAVDPVTGGRQHTTEDGNRYGESAHYASDRVLFHVPPAFDPARPFCLVVYFHGHLSELRRNVVEEMAVPRQVTASGANVVLVAPQLAVNAIDSNPGKLMEAGGLARLVDEAADVLTATLGLPDGGLVRGAPIVLAAFSGGYRAVAHGLERGGLGRRVIGVLLFDAIFGEVDRFTRWLLQEWAWGFFVALHSPSSAPRTEELIARLAARGVRHRSGFPERIGPGTLSFGCVDTDHNDVPVVGPPAWPIAQALRGMTRLR